MARSDGRAGRCATATARHRTIWSKRGALSDAMTTATAARSSFIVLAGAEVLRGIVATARAGAAFIGANVRRIRVLAALMLGYFVLTVARSIVAVIIQDDLGLERTSTDISFAPIVSAVVLLALAQIWQYGVKLREEQELTI
jgi:hypothetical protein